MPRIPDAVPSDVAPVIVLNDIVKRYAPDAGIDVTALDGVSADIHESEFVVVTGRSGSGKTTLLNVMAGLVEPTSGTVHVEGTDLWALSDDDRSRVRNRRIGFVFQFPSLMPMLTVLENVVLPVTFSAESEAAVWTERASELLGLVGVADKAASYPRHLSAGQQQRVVLARALLMEPRIILADEPTSNLDEQTEQEMLALLRSIHEQTGVTIVMVTHAPALASYGTRELVMHSGLIAEAQ